MRKVSKESDKRKIGFFSSMKTKMAVMLIMVSVVTAVTLLLIVVPVFRNVIKQQTKNYMYDVTISNGAVLETMTSLDDADALNEMFSGVGVEDVESSYAYIVASDGTMLYHPTPEKIGQPVENEVIKGVVKELTKGNPVIIYVTGGELNDPVCVEGQEVPVNLHVILLVGYNGITKQVIVKDPWTHNESSKYKYYPESRITSIYNQVGKKSVIVG